MKKQKQEHGLQVRVYNNNVDRALKNLKRKIKDSELMVELRNRSYFEKPSNKNRRKKNLSKTRQKYRQEKENF